MREEEKKVTSKIRRILKKRWALSAIYVAAAALVLAAAFFLQNSFQDSAKDEESAESGKNFNEPSVEVNSNLETVKMPVADADKTVIKKQFYDVNGDEKSQEEALVFYDNRYEQNKGVDIAMEDGKSFEVKASLSGKVAKVQEDALLGNVIEVENGDGVVTRYQSVKDIQVAVGDKVKQGQVLASAGKSQINEEAGVHVHFEIRKDNVAVNPVDFIDKQASAIQAATVEKEEAKEDETSKEEAPAVEDSETDVEKAPASDESNEGAELENGTDETPIPAPGEDSSDNGDSQEDSMNEAN